MDKLSLDTRLNNKAITISNNYNLIQLKQQANGRIPYYYVLAKKNLK